MKELGSTPRLAPGDYGELCRVLRKILQKDRCAAKGHTWFGGARGSMARLLTC